MLVWINGPFGGGKTQTAYELARRCPGSTVCDPEHVGFGLKRALPRGVIGDFQDLRAWRQGVVEVLDIARDRGLDPLIVPMTVIEPEYFAETVGRLREHGHDVRHFSLLARRETVLRRLRQRVPVLAVLRLVRGERQLRRESFAVGMLDRCLHSLAGPEFAEHITTDDRSVAQVAGAVAASAGLRLLPPTDPPWRGRLRRSVVSLRHIRI